MVNLMDMVNIHGQIKLFLKDISWTVFEMVRDYGVGKIHAENLINIVDIMKMIKKMRHFICQAFLIWFVKY